MSNAVGGRRRVRLVPLDPSSAGAAVVGPALHHGPGEPAGAPALLVTQQDGPEGDRRDVEAERLAGAAWFGAGPDGDLDARFGWETVRPQIFGDGERRGGVHLTRPLDISKEHGDADVHPDVGQVDP